MAQPEVLFADLTPDDVCPRCGTRWPPEDPEYPNDHSLVYCWRCGKQKGI